MHYLLILFLWIIAILVATVSISFYIRKFQRTDVATALYVLFITISQIMAAKFGDFSIGSLQITAPTAVLIFPFTFQLTDYVNEYFGQHETHRMILIAFITQLFMSLFLWLSIEIAPALNWIDPALGGDPNAPVFWGRFFGTTLRITAASWISFLITENLDALIYAKIKQKMGGRYLWVRNVFSDIPTLALDSCIFIFLAFSWTLPWQVLGTIILGQILTKWFFGILDTPFMYLAHAIMRDKIKFIKKWITSPQDHLSSRDVKIGN